jgi:hypothetical protein
MQRKFPVKRDVGLVPSGSWVGLKFGRERNGAIVMEMDNDDIRERRVVGDRRFEIYLP